jgi:hypothetical protein
MQQAGKQMHQGDDAQEQQNEALERLNEAQRELQQAREEVEEELAREKLAKIAEQIKGLRERQVSLSAEAQRIHQLVLQNKRWTRLLQGSLTVLAENQNGLGDETENLTKQKLEGSKVFAHLLNKSAEAMKKASEQMLERLQKEDNPLPNVADAGEAGLNVAEEEAAQAETQRWQTAALRRIDQLLDALKPEDGMMAGAAQPRKEGNDEPGEGGQGTGAMNEDGIPPLAQLKALRALQQEVNERTQVFAKRHPSLAQLTVKEKDELRAIHQEQQEIHDLFQEVTATAEPEGEKK